MKSKRRYVIALVGIGLAMVAALLIPALVGLDRIEERRETLSDKADDIAGATTEADRKAESNQQKVDELIQTVKGEKGEPGKPGADGEPVPSLKEIVAALEDEGLGERGPKGAMGPTGPMGSDGADGLPGPAGPVGPTGPLGPRGPAGGDGEPGPPGPMGPMGRPPTDAELDAAVARYCQRPEEPCRGAPAPMEPAPEPAPMEPAPPPPEPAPPPAPPAQ